MERGPTVGSPDLTGMERTIERELLAARFGRFGRLVPSHNECWAFRRARQSAARAAPPRGSSRRILTEDDARHQTDAAGGSRSAVKKVQNASATAGRWLSRGIWTQRYHRRESGAKRGHTDVTIGSQFQTGPRSGCRVIRRLTCHEFVALLYASALLTLVRSHVDRAQRH